MKAIDPNQSIIFRGLPRSARLKYINWAENQQDLYHPLPSWRIEDDPRTPHVFQWKPTFWECLKLMFGVPLFQTILTFGGKLQPQRFDIGKCLKN